MSYTNPLHENRLITISCVRDAFGGLSVRQAAGAVCSSLEGAETRGIYNTNEGCGDGDLYHFPFLLHADGDPWHEANSYLLSILRDKETRGQRTDDIRRRAVKLLDYLFFCEKSVLDWLDFSGSRPSHRPTYKYFYHLINQGGRSPAVVNQYTAVVFNFYKYVSEHWHVLDLKRVDTVKKMQFIVHGAKGAALMTAQKRSQTRRTPPSSPVPLGFVREDGEDLRPLSNIELGDFLSVVRREEEWNAVERLILLFSLMTGARKQSVLTIKLKHLELFAENNLEQEGAYRLHAGLGTGIDTKYDKRQVLYIPKQLAEELVTLARSPMMRERRKKFAANLLADFPGLSMDEGDMYLFLSNQGNCYYMAKDDPRYTFVKSPQTGQVTETIKKKLARNVSSRFPNDFSYHWLRATYAFQLYQRLQVLVQKGLMQPNEVIGFIQKRMHHESRETTENYLKLFKMTHHKILAQEVWEQKLFRNSGYDTLNFEV